MEEPSGGARVTVYRHTAELHEEFAGRRDAIRDRLDEFAAIRQDQYFYELVYCLLTPQSSAVNASKVVDQLRTLDFAGRPITTVEVLRKREHYIRFHNTKAGHLARAKVLFPELDDHLKQTPPGSEEEKIRNLREWLTHHVPGLGWKESSHFLRNIGYRNLAILDRHILRNLQRHGVIRSIPKTLSPKRYVEIERRFQNFAASIGIAMDELDLLFWSRETGEIRK